MKTNKQRLIKKAKTQNTNTKQMGTETRDKALRVLLEQMKNHTFEPGKPTNKPTQTNKQPNEQETTKRTTKRYK